MDLSGIISVSGMSGLHKVIAKTKSGLLIESISDKKRVPIQSTDKVSALEDISIFTTGEDLPLKEVLKKIRDNENGAATSVDTKSENNALKNYFKGVLPEFDDERVYASNIKKVMEWYNILQKADLLKDTESSEKSAEAESNEGKNLTKKSESATKKTKKTEQPKQTAVKASSKSAGGPRVTTRKSGSA